MIVVTYPLVLISALITKVFLKDSNGQTTTREKIAAMARTKDCFQTKKIKLFKIYLS